MIDDFSVVALATFGTLDVCIYEDCLLDLYCDIDCADFSLHFQFESIDNLKEISNFLNNRQSHTLKIGTSFGKPVEFVWDYPEEERFFIKIMDGFYMVHIYGNRMKDFADCFNKILQEIDQ